LIGYWPVTQYTHPSPHGQSAQQSAQQLAETSSP
jgi:hypothetical protein